MSRDKSAHHIGTPRRCDVPYDIFIFGNMSIGIVKTPTEEYEIPGGPILFATWTAHQLGNSVSVLTKTALKDKYRLSEFPLADLDLFWRESPETTSNRAVYQTKSMETRVLTNLAQATPYKIEDFPAYISERFTRKPVDAIQFAAALTSMKMEIPGPFNKTRKEVEAFIRAFY